MMHHLFLLDLFLLDLFLLALLILRYFDVKINIEVTRRRR
jgi:hypothetical protein